MQRPTTAILSALAFGVIMYTLQSAEAKGGGSHGGGHAGGHAGGGHGAAHGGGHAAEHSKGHFAQNHPRRAEVGHRDNNLSNRMNRDYGHLGGHYGQLSREARHIHNQEKNWAHQNGGYITKGEQHQLNHEENHLNQQISHDWKEGPPHNDFAKDHPRRAEVNGRDVGLGRQLANDRGNLGNHYGQLMNEQRSIQGQEQRDAARNGGYITAGQQNKLNREENGLQNQINKDLGTH